MREEKRESGVMVAVAGTSQSGKTTWLIERLKPAQRVIVWDPRGEYTKAGCVLIQDMRELAARLKDAWDGEGKFCYWGPKSDFNTWCELAHSWGQLWPAAIVGEELADVSHNGGSSDAWGELVRKGLFFGSHIYGVTQRPQEIHKVIWGNAHIRHCHRLELPLDARYMADVLGCDQADILAMQDYQWIERRSGDPMGRVHRGGNLKGE